MRAAGDDMAVRKVRVEVGREVLAALRTRRLAAKAAEALEKEGRRREAEKASGKRRQTSSTG